MSSAEQAKRRRDAIRNGTYVGPPERAPFLQWPRCAEDGTPLGVDLSRTWPEIEGYVRRYCRAPWGHDMRDVLQEVALVISRRNHMPSAHDPRKSNLRRYIYMVGKCVCANMANVARDHIPQEPIDEERLLDTGEAYLPQETLDAVLELRASGLVTEMALSYTLTALAGGDTSSFGPKWQRRALQESVRGAVGP